MSRSLVMTSSLTAEAPGGLPGRLISALSERLRANLSLVDDQPPPEPPSAEDERLFAAVCQKRCVSSVRLIGALTIFFTVLWWPTDLLVYGRARGGLLAAALQRVTMVVAPAVVLLLLRRRRAAAHAVLLFDLSLFLCCAALGHSAGLLGTLDDPWFHMLLVVPYLPLLIPLRLGQRALHTPVGSLGLWAGLLVPFPGNLSSPYLPLALSVHVAACLVSVLLGHALFVLNRQGFLQSRVIHRDAEMLKDHSARLEQRVAERTAELRRLLAHVEVAREQERTRMSHELHDELGQELAVLGYEVAVLQRRCAERPQDLETQVEDLAAQLEHARRTLRALVTDLRPRVLDDLGLCAAVESLLVRTDERGELRCRLTLTGEQLPVPDDVGIAAFRIVQESLTNVLRHAGATTVDVRVDITAEAVALRITDDGRGVTPAALAAATGVGVLGMRERATHLGGELSIEPAPGQGTELRCVLPMRGAGAAGAPPG